VGESVEEMYHVVETVEPHMPTDRPRYLMGVGTPINLLESIARGVDFFDCVLPARNARHGHLYTQNGRINLKNEKYASDNMPIDPACDCPACRRHSRAYIRHLFKSGEILALRLAVQHNLYFFNKLMADARLAIEQSRFDTFLSEQKELLDKRL